ncbi:MAG: S8 family peptidase, partial [Acidimicrobiia bacterium]
MQPGQDLDAAGEALVEEARRLGAHDAEVVAQDEDRGLLLLDGVDEQTGEAMAAHRVAARVVPDFTFDLALSATTAKVGADKTKQAGLTGAGQVVAVVDTGVAALHPALKDAVIVEKCFVYEGTGCPNGTNEQDGPGAAAPPCPVPDPGTSQLCNHGTHVAGIVAARSVDSMPSGVAPGASIVAIRIFGSNGKASYWDLLDALRWIDLHGVAMGVDAVNLSLTTDPMYAGSCDSEPSLSDLRDLVDSLRAKNIAVVVATGNGSPGSIGQVAVPACLSQTISVSATTLGDALASFSHVARATTLLAPGVNVLAPVPAGYARMSGTSMAAPHVAGSIAVLRGLGDYSVDRVVSALRGGGRPVWTGVGIIPRLDVDAALRPPHPPLVAAASAGDRRATVSWSAGSRGIGAALTGYQVVASPGGATKLVGAST